jgi:hypothetical protein
MTATLRFALALAGALIAFASCACALGHAQPISECSTDSLTKVASAPTSYAGKTFCGYVYAFRQDRTVRIVAAPTSEVSYDLVFLVTTRTVHRLTGVSETPYRYFVRAELEIQPECFIPSESGESCVPYSHPVFMNILAASRAR